MKKKSRTKALALVKESNVPISKSEQTNPQPQSINERIYIVVLFLLPLIVYAFGFGNQFITTWDDNQYITENEWIKEPLKNLSMIFRSRVAANYHPLTMLTLALNVLIFGKGAASFIVVNSLIHAFNTYLVFVFIKKLLQLNAEGLSVKSQFYVAFFTGLFFGIHPMHVESVVWISERKDVLYTCFFLLGLIKYCDYIKNSQSKTLGLVFLFFVLSCLSKGQAVVFPLVLILIDHWSGKSLFGFDTLKNKIAFLAFALFWGILTLNVQGGKDFYGLLITIDDYSTINKTNSLGLRLLCASYGLWIYFYKLLLPINLHNFYKYPFSENIVQNQYYLCLLFLLAIVIVWTYSYFRNNRVLFFSLSFFFITIILVLQFLGVGSAVLSERYTYVPYIGLLFMLFYFLFFNFSQPKLYALTIVAIFFSVLSIKAVKVWKSELSLWENNYDKDGLSTNTSELLSEAYRLSGDLEAMYKVCMESKTNFVESALINENLGNYLFLKNDYKNALYYYAEAIKLAKTNRIEEKKMVQDILVNQAITYRNLGDFEKANISYESALKIFPEFENNLKVYKERANMKIGMGQYPAALTDLNNLISKGFGNDTTYNIRAVARFNLGDSKGAVSDLETAVKLNPGNTEAVNNLAKIKGLAQ
jgi:tetratricopeptide (TPR) repeat protein